MHILRGNLLKALREKYFCDAKKNAEEFIGWKPDEIHEVKAKNGNWSTLLVFHRC